MGLYSPTRSPLHRAPLGLKVVLLLGVSGTVLVIHEWHATAGALLGVVLLYGFGARASVRSLLRTIVPLLPILALLGTYQGFANGLVEAFIVDGNLLVCVLAARLLTLTTPGQVLLDGVVSAVTPLRVVGADPERFGLALAIMVRSIPYLMGSVLDIRDAARARGLERNPRAMITPAVVNAVAYAHQTGQALAARGIGDHYGDDAPTRRDRT